MQGENQTTGPTADVEDVCIVTQPLSSAGESATQSLLEILSSITTVSLLTPYLAPESDLRDRYTVVEISDSNTGDGILVPAVRFVANQLRMCRSIWGREEGIVLFFGSTAYLLPILVAKIRGKTVVLEPRGDVPLTLRLYWERRVPDLVARLLAGSVWSLERAGFLLADAIVTYTRGVADELDLTRFEAKLYTDGARYVDTDRFYPHTPFEDRDLAVGFLGRLDEEKGIRVLAEVSRRLSDDVTFRFIGDGDLRGWLETELEDEIATGRVAIEGWVPHDTVPVELSRLRLLVMPSAPTEGLPTTILESMACGTPVYATPVAGVPDVVRDGETGFLLQDLEPNAIVADVERFLEWGELEETSARGEALVRSEFSFQAARRRYTHVLESISWR